jgi:hypothetical protein
MQPTNTPSDRNLEIPESIEVDTNLIERNISSDTISNSDVHEQVAFETNSGLDVNESEKQVSVNSKKEKETQDESVVIADEVVAETDIEVATVATSESVVIDESGVASTAEDDDDSSVLYTGVGLLGLGGLALGGGSSDSAEPAPVTPPPTPSQLLTGNLVMGPVIAGNGLSYNVYALTDINPDGSLKDGASVLATGTFTTGGEFAVTVEFDGAVVVRVSDDDTTAGITLDYIDEATGVAVDLSVTELNAAVVLTGTGSQNVNINVFTQVAYELLLDSPLTSANVVTANQTVTNAVGLVDDIVTGSAPIAVIDTNGQENTNANTYGQLLAAASGVDETGSTSATVQSIKTSVTDAVNPVVATANLLLAGALNVVDVLPSFADETELTLADFFFIADAINSLRDEIQSNQSSLTTIQNGIDQNQDATVELLSGDLSDLSSLVSTFTSSVSTSLIALQSSIDSLNDSTVVNANAITALEDNVTQISTDISSLIADAEAALEAAVTNLTSLIETNELDISDLSEAVVALTGLFAENNASLKDDIEAAIEAADTALEAAVASLTTLIQTNELDISELSAAIVSLTDLTAENIASVREDTEAALEAAVASLTTLIETNELDISDLNAALVVLNDLHDEDILNIETTIAAIQVVIADLTARIEVLEAQPNTNELDNRVDLLDFADGVSIDMQAGDDFVNASPGDDIITGGPGADQINLTTSDKSVDVVVYESVTDGQSNPVSTISFSGNEEHYQEGTKLTVNINGSNYSYQVSSDDGESVYSAMTGLATSITNNISFSSYSQIKGDAFHHSSDWDNESDNAWVYRDSDDFGTDFINWYADGDYNDIEVLTLYYIGNDGDIAGDDDHLSSDFTTNYEYEYGTQLTVDDVKSFINSNSVNVRSITLSELMAMGGEYTVGKNVIAITQIGELLLPQEDRVNVMDGSVFAQGQTFSLANTVLAQSGKHLENNDYAPFAGELFIATAKELETYEEALISQAVYYGSYGEDLNLDLKFNDYVNILGGFEITSPVENVTVNVNTGNNVAFDSLAHPHELFYFRELEQSGYIGEDVQSPVADFEDANAVLFTNGNDVFEAGQILQIDGDNAEAIWTNADSAGVLNWGHYNVETFSNGRLLTINDFKGDEFAINGGFVNFDEVNSGELVVDSANQQGLTVLYQQVYTDDGSNPSVVQILITNAVNPYIDVEGDVFVVDQLEDASIVKYAMFTGDANNENFGEYTEAQIVTFVEQLLSAEASAELTIVGTAGEELSVAAGGIYTDSAIQNDGVTTKYDIEFPTFESDWPTQNNGTNTTIFDRQVSVLVNIAGEDHTFTTDILYGEDINGAPIVKIYETLEDLVDEINYYSGEDGLGITADLLVDREVEADSYDWLPTHHEYYIEGNSAYGFDSTGGGGTGGTGPGWDVYSQTLNNYLTSAVIRIEADEVPVSADAAPTFTVNADIEQNGTQQFTEVDFSTNNAYYYEGGKIGITFGEDTVSVDMIANNASGTLAALNTALQEYISADNAATPDEGFESISYDSTTGVFSLLSDSELTNDVSIDAFTDYEGEAQIATVQFSTDDDDYYDGGQLSLTIDKTPDDDDDDDGDVVVTANMVVGDADASIDALVSAVNTELSGSDSFLTAAVGEDGVITLTSTDHARHLFDIADARINYIDGEKIALELLLGNQYLESAALLGETLSVKISSHTYEVLVTQDLVNQADTSQAVVDALLTKIRNGESTDGTVAPADTSLDLAAITSTYDTDLNVHVINFVALDSDIVGADNLSQYAASITENDGANINEVAAILNAEIAEVDTDTASTDGITNPGDDDTFYGIAPGYYQASDDILYLDDDTTINGELTGEDTGFYTDVMDLYDVTGEGDAISGADETFMTPVANPDDEDDFFIRTEDKGTHAYDWNSSVVSVLNAGSLGYDAITGFQAAPTSSISSDGISTFRIDAITEYAGYIEVTVEFNDGDALYESTFGRDVYQIVSDYGEDSEVYGIENLSFSVFFSDDISYEVNVVVDGVSVVDPGQAVGFAFDAESNQLIASYVGFEDTNFDLYFFGESQNIYNPESQDYFAGYYGEDFNSDLYFDEVGESAIVYDESMDSILLSGNLASSTTGSDIFDYEFGRSDNTFSSNSLYINGFNDNYLALDIDVLETTTKDGYYNPTFDIRLEQWNDTNPMLLAYGDAASDVVDTNGNGYIDVSDYAVLEDVDVWNLSLLSGIRFDNLADFEAALNSIKVISDTDRTLSIFVGDHDTFDNYFGEFDNLTIAIAQEHLNTGEFELSYQLQTDYYVDFGQYATEPRFLDLSDAKGVVVNSDDNAEIASGFLDTVTVGGEAANIFYYFGEDAFANDPVSFGQSSISVSVDNGNSFTSYSVGSYESIDTLLEDINEGGIVTAEINEQDLLIISEINTTDELVVDFDLNINPSYYMPSGDLFDMGGIDNQAYELLLYTLIHDAGISRDQINGTYSTPESLDVTSDELTDADAAAALLNELFNFDLTTDNGELNTTVFAITASDDASLSAVWVHTQSSTDDSTVDAEELTLLTTVETTEDGELVADSFIFEDVIETQPII